MFVVQVTFVIILIAQFLIGAYSWYYRKRLPNRYSHILSDLPEPAKILENYSRIFRQVNLRVNAQIPEPAFAQENFLLVNRSRMYSNDLYSNYYLIFQLEMTKPKHRFLRNIYVYQNILFWLQIVTFVLTFAFTGDLALVFGASAIGISIFLLLLSVFGFFLYQFVLDEAHDIALDLLNLDDVEAARAESLKDDIRYQSFEYPFETVWRIYQFFKP